MYSDEEENDESKSESFGDVSSEGSVYCPPQMKPKQPQKQKKKSPKKQPAKSKTPKQTSNNKKREKEICTVDAVVQGDETLGVPPDF